ncbi:MAG: hypothetical protein HY331_17540 [Chloroflexi bacterium]|nr:hypothetical protein [Chloroflexota bacterium]
MNPLLGVFSGLTLSSEGMVTKIRGRSQGIRVRAEPEEAIWSRRIEDEQETGGIPFPAVDSIIIYDDRAPSILLVAPHLVPGTVKVFVMVDAMSSPDRSVLRACLDQLVFGTAIHVVAVYHVGGLDYELRFPDGGAVRLRQLHPSMQSKIWHVLNDIALLGARYPDYEASTPRRIPAPDRLDPSQQIDQTSK